MQNIATATLGADSAEDLDKAIREKLDKCRGWHVKDIKFSVSRIGDSFYKFHAMIILVE